MSEQQIEEALGAMQSEALVEEVVDGDLEEDLSNLSPTELRAWNDGWRPEDQFEGNLDNWKTAGEYNLYGEMQGQIREAKSEARRVSQDSDARIANLNRLHQAQQEAAIAEMRSQQRDAVNDMDTDKYDKIQDKIDKTQAAAQQYAAPAPVTATDPQIADWESRNEWVHNPNDERTQQANSFYAIASKKSGATIDSCLKYVDTQLAKLHPELATTQQNPRRNMPSMTETSTPRSRTRTKEPTMDSLTASERQDWDKFGSIMFTEKQFLKSIADSRKS